MLSLRLFIWYERVKFTNKPVYINATSLCILLLYFPDYLLSCLLIAKEWKIPLTNWKMIALKQWRIWTLGWGEHFWRVAFSFCINCSPCGHCCAPPYMKFKAMAWELRQYFSWIRIFIYGGQNEFQLFLRAYPLCNGPQVLINSYSLLSHPKAATISQAVTSQAPALEMHYSWHDYVGMIYNCKLDTNLIISAR